MIRIGRISKVDKEKGMASVVYEDQDDLTTDMLPILKPFLRGAIHDTTPDTKPISVDHFMKLLFDPPKVGDYVVVAHTNNNPSRGVILGWYYNEVNQPEVDDG